MMVLSQRALNRATLARQLLLERVHRPTVEVIEHLVGATGTGQRRLVSLKA